jgi:hypothetical protein
LPAYRYARILSSGPNFTASATFMSHTRGSVTDFARPNLRGRMKG